MEVGAVKQAFNNEVIMMKNKLNQAKIQIIHKLTRKAKTLLEKKAPDQLKEKLKRKAESAINEVLIIKKIKPRDIAKFTVTHTGELNTFLNRPQVDKDKACARLLLHKALQDKYKLLRNKFSNIPIDDLLMSRIERRKLKKEEKEAQKAKKSAKLNKKNAKLDDWNVEDAEIREPIAKIAKDGLSDNDDEMSVEESGDEIDHDSELSNNESASDESSESDDEANGEDGVEENSGKDEEQSDGENEKSKIKVNNNNVKESISSTTEIENKTFVSDSPKADVKQKQKTIKNIVKQKKQKNRNKNESLGEKLLQRKSKKEDSVEQTKIVDPFFITSSGENYISVVEPRKPDEIKAEHRQGNRQYRRAVLFGHEPKVKPRRDNFRQDKNNYNNQNSSDKNAGARNNFNNRQGPYNRQTNNERNNSNDRNSQNNKMEDPKPEKLHPSWEAKKKKSGIQPFQGKKIVFDET